MRNAPCEVIYVVSFQVPVCVHGCLCEREKVDDSGSLCVLSWLTGPVMMMSSIWLVSTPIAVEVLIPRLYYDSGVLYVLTSCLFFLFLSAKKVRARTSYITISSSSDSDDEPVRFVPNAPVVVKDDEEDELSILEVTGAAFRFTGSLCSVHCSLHT